MVIFIPHGRNSKNNNQQKNKSKGFSQQHPFARNFCVFFLEDSFSESEQKNRGKSDLLYSDEFL